MRTSEPGRKANPIILPNVVVWCIFAPVSALMGFGSIYAVVRYFLPEVLQGAIACAYWLSHLDHVAMPVSRSAQFVIGEMLTAIATMGIAGWGLIFFLALSMPTAR